MRALYAPGRGCGGLMMRFETLLLSLDRGNASFATARPHYVRRDAVQQQKSVLIFVRIVLQPVDSTPSELRCPAIYVRRHVCTFGVVLEILEWVHGSGVGPGQLRAS